MHSGDSVSFVNGRGAPWCEIPNDNVVSVEHPGIVKNVDNAILSLGGDAKLATVRSQHRPHL